MEKVDDEEYAKEKEWIEGILEKALTLKFCAEDYILKSKETHMAQENTGENGKTVTTEDQTKTVNADNNSEDVELIEENQNSVQETLKPASEPEVDKFEIISEKSKVDTKINPCAFKVEKPKLPKFKGDVTDYVVFRADFNHAVAITILRSSLKGKPLELIEGIEAAWDYLNLVY